VFLFANVVGEPADGKEVGRTVELDAVVESEALTRQDFVGDGLEALVSEDDFAQVAGL
jgi:hypothetical protein